MLKRSNGWIYVVGSVTEQPDGPFPLQNEECSSDPEMTEVTEFIANGNGGSLGMLEDTSADVKVHCSDAVDIRILLCISFVARRKR